MADRSRAQDSSASHGSEAALLISLASRKLPESEHVQLNVFYHRIDELATKGTADEFWDTSWRTRLRTFLLGLVIRTRHMRAEWSASDLQRISWVSLWTLTINAASCGRQFYAVRIPAQKLDASESNPR